MSREENEIADGENPTEIYEQLMAAHPEDSREIVLRLIAEHPEARLHLPSSGGKTATLRRVDLENINLRGANLEEAVLAEANLAGANLEEANLENADLAGANLRGASLAEANLAGAMLEDADISDAALRFVDLTGAILENANLENSDLWGAKMADGDLTHANLMGATLNEADLTGAVLTGANLQNASLVGANFQAAKMREADLRGAKLSGANLEKAVLKKARLEDVDLSNCKIAGIFIGGARLDKTRFSLEQLGGAIGEELSKEYEEARIGYLALERNFAETGDPDAASWAYRRRRRMQKLEARRRAQEAFKAKDWKNAVKNYVYYAQDKTAELVCDYGESIPRVLLSLVFMWVFFALLYDATGSVVRVVEVSGETVKTVSHNFFELGIFSLLAMTTSGSPAVGLLPSSQAVHFITGIQALLGISFTGLLGFVVGNRIRR